MKVRVHHAVRGLILLLVALAPARADKPADAKHTEKTLPPEARQDLLNLVRRYNAARGNAKEAEAVVRRAVEIGELGVKRLGPTVEKDYQAARLAYQKLFAQEAAAVNEKLNRDGQPADKEAGVALEKLLESSNRLAEERERVLGVERLMKLLIDAASNEKANKSGEKAAERKAEFLALSVERFESAALQQLRDIASLHEFDPEEAAVVTETNKQRAAYGLPPLVIDRGLCLAAADHSRDMVEHGFFDHESPLKGKTTPYDRAKNFKTTAGGENIAQAKSGTAAVEMWMESEGHRGNILDPHFRRIGVGRSSKHFTQMFGR